MSNKWNIKIDGRRMTANQIIEEIFENRGIDDIDGFLHPTDKDMIPFEKLKNIDLAAERLLYWLDNDGKILVYFDSDTDGCTSGSIMTRYLRAYLDDKYSTGHNANIETYINNGKLHGMVNFDFDLLANYDLLIIVDAMEDSVDNYDEVFKRNCDIIVLDHHQIPQSVLDIQEKICLVSSANDYPNPELSGAGVVYKFCRYIDDLTLNDFANDYSDLSATGILADVSSVGPDSMENRYICTLGFNNVKNPGIKRINGSYEMNSTAVGFGIAPLINAGNRSNNNTASMELFLADDDKYVKSLIKELKQNKEDQNAKVNAIFEQMEEQAKEQLDHKCLYFFIEDGEDSVAGLLANKALGKYHRPVMVLRDSDTAKEYKGSMRAVGVKNFNKIINDTKLAQCYGHASAAGVKIPTYFFNEVRDRIEEALADIDFSEETDVDVRLQQAQVTFDLVKRFKEINKISGKGFAPIKVELDNITDYTITSMGDGKHLKIDTDRMSFIMWNFNDWGSVHEGMIFSAIGTLDMNYFGRNMVLQLIMEDFKFEDFDI